MEVVKGAAGTGTNIQERTCIEKRQNSREHCKGQLMFVVRGNMLGVILGCCSGVVFSLAVH